MNWASEVIIDEYFEWCKHLQEIIWNGSWLWWGRHERQRTGRAWYAVRFDSFAPGDAYMRKDVLDSIHRPLSKPMIAYCQYDSPSMDK